jgi:undecaprenyl diphosphate synthase
MDGNGRWAKKRFMPRIVGHKKGARVFRQISKHCSSIGVKYFTAYAFSTENWNRPADEVSGLMNILRDYLRDFFISRQDYVGFKTKFIGDISLFDPDIIQLMKEIEEDSSQYDDINVNIAVNYGGRQEICSAVKKIAEDIEKGVISSNDINSDIISNNLYTANQPDPELIIRTSGEQRISNFLLWQSAYAEYVFTNILWPDFTPKDLDNAIDEFRKRQRRYGGI